MLLQRHSNRQTLTIETDSPLRRGGEGRVYPVREDAALAAKLYEDPDTRERARKLKAMLANPPHPPRGEVIAGHTPVAWPLDLLCEPGNPTRVRGFLMKRVTGMRCLIDAYDPRTRLQAFPGFHYEYLLATAKNLATAFHYLHARGYVIGDVKPQNILVSDTALVTLVDTDSFQVKDPANGHVFSAPMGTPDYTAPELLNNSHPAQALTQEQDLFGLATLLFQLLMLGLHPFSGVYQGDDDPPPYEERIREGHFPYGSTPGPYRPKSRNAPPFSQLPPALREKFLACFEAGHANPQLRPTADVWRRALDSAQRTLRPCADSDQHWYGNHLSDCPWCALGRSDPFPPLPESEPEPVVAPVMAKKPPPVIVPTPRSEPPRRSLLDTFFGRGGTGLALPSSPVSSVQSPRISLVDRAALIWIPVGEFLMGSNEYDDEKPQRIVFLDGYYIYKTPVTVAQYRQFCTAMKRPMPSLPKWSGNNHPMVNVSWDNAMAYCQWISETSGLTMNLPTEAQWEKAARGMDGRDYPWAGGWDRSKCVNSVGPNNPGATKPVGNYPQGASPYGALDMAGNVLEWCLDWYDANYYKSAPNRNPTGPTKSASVRALRGGSWVNYLPIHFRCAHRNGVIPTSGVVLRGFRCAVSE